jgi:uncharacterized membrane protein YbhN (UPF0104 family)
MSSTKLNMPPHLRRLLHLLGSMCALAGVVFVGVRLHAYWQGADIARITPSIWSMVAVLALVYGAANTLLALAWWQLLQVFGAADSRLGAFRIYGMSQLAKYVPGNIFHLAGRQAMGMAAGMPAAALARSALWELGLIAVAGALSGWMVLPLLMPQFPEWAGVLLALSCTLAIAALLRTLRGPGAMRAFLAQLLFLVVSSAVFVALLGLMAGTGGLDARYWLAIGSAYTAAWLAGLVTPGAPAGLGVREAILLFLLKGMVAEADLLMAVLLGRVVTVAGDVLFFAVAACIPSKSFASQN